MGGPRMRKHGESKGGGGKSKGGGKGKGGDRSSSKGSSKGGGKDKGKGDRGKSTGKGKGSSSKGKGKDSKKGSSSKDKKADRKGSSKGSSSKGSGAEQPVGTRKERKWAKDNPGKAPKTKKGEKPAAAEADKKKKGRKERRDLGGQKLATLDYKAPVGTDTVAPSGRSRKHRVKRKKKNGAAGAAEMAAPTVGAMPLPFCKSGHKMQKVTENPRGYSNIACCDVCAMQNLPLKLKHFFHCSFCKFDMCIRCATEEGKKRKPEKKPDPESDEPKGKKRKIAAAKDDVDEEKALGFNRARREIWLPTEETSVNRAPVKAAPNSIVSDLSDWVV